MNEKVQVRVDASRRTGQLEHTDPDGGGRLSCRFTLQTHGISFLEISAVR